MFRLKRRGAYTPMARSLAHTLVQSGCSQKKVGHTIRTIAAALGVSVKECMSAHTVWRAVLEGGIAADIQLGYEISQAQSK